MREQLTKEWIDKVNKEYGPLADEINRAYWRKANESRPAVNGRKRYAQTLNGKEMRREVNALRVKRFRGILPKEKEENMLIKKFYSDCPKDHHVDHIIPIAKGGRHELSNLQWLPKMINQWKGMKSILKEGDFPQCIINIKNRET